MVLVDMKVALIWNGGGYEHYFFRLIRALAGISLGGFVGGVAFALKQKKWNNRIKVLLTIIKFFFIVMVIGEGFYINESQSYMVLLGLPVILLSFCGNTYIVEGNKLTNVLGKLSMIIYLTHFILISIFKSLFPGQEKYALIGIIISPFFAFGFMKFTDYLLSAIKWLLLRINE